MKNIFNGKRFMLLLKKEAYDLRNQYLKLMLIVACTYLVVFLISLLAENESFTDYTKTRYIICATFIVGAILLSPFQLYKRYNHKVYGVNYFMLPASQAEKWLSMFINCVVAIPVVIILTITLVDLCTYPFLPWADKSLWLAFSNFSNPNLYSDKTLSDILMFFAFQSILFLGNIWFKRAKVQKTIAAIITLMIAFAVFALIFAKILGTEIFQHSGSPSALENMVEAVSHQWKTITKIIYYLVAPIGLWIVSFLKLKEQQL
jgi:hypothetical protein